MNIYKPLQISVNTRLLEQGGRFHFIATAMLGIDLKTGMPQLEFDYIKDAFECMGSKPLPDPGMPKPKGEYLVCGKCYSASGPVGGQEVLVKVGNRVKSLFISGDRKWIDGYPSKPEPFTTMPVDYLHAFGGLSFNNNPDGKGFKDGNLPNIEYARSMMTSESDIPEIAGFAPLDPSWPQRMRFQPSYGSDYLNKYYPGYPDNFDWHYFLSAPQDQWFDHFPQGNEHFEIHHMHPEIKCIKGALPGLYPRCFINHTATTPEGSFEELPLQLDTIWFFPEKTLAMLIWRGGTYVIDDEAETIKNLLFGYERLTDEARAVEYYQNALTIRLSGSDTLLNNFNTEDLIPPNHKCAMELLQERAFSEKVSSRFSDNFNAKVESLKKMADEKLEESLTLADNQISSAPIPDSARTDIRKLLDEQNTPPSDPDIDTMKHDIDSILPGLMSGNPAGMQLKHFSFDKIDKVMDIVNKFTDKKEKDIKEKVTGQIARVKEQVAEQRASISSDTFPSECNSQLDESMTMLDEFNLETAIIATLPRLKSEEIMNSLSTLSPQLLTAMQYVQNMKLLNGNPQDIDKLEKQFNELLTIRDTEIKHTLEEAELGFKECYFMGAHAMCNGLSPHKESLEKVKNTFLEAFSSGEDMRNRDWACIDLSGEVLDTIDLSGAYLEQVNLKGASLKNAKLCGAILARANLESADLSGADLSGSNIGAVYAYRTNFTGANLNHAILSKGNFSHASFFGCSMEEIDSQEIIIDTTDFSGASIPSLKSITAQIKNSTFKGTRFPSSVFLESTITNCDFSDADLSCSVIADSRIENSTFDRADCSKVCFAATAPEKTTLNALSFIQTNMSSANFKDMHLKKTNFSGATMENTNFGGASLSESNFSMVKGKGAQFRKADLAKASFVNSNLMECSLAKADCTETIFDHANLYCADLLRSNLFKTKLNNCNLDRTLLKEWKKS
jgi:uncharacterized protein YjbI with pentapeptide repeats